MSLALTIVQSLVMKDPELSKNVNRRSRYGALDTFQRQTNTPGGPVNPMLQMQYEGSQGRTVTIPVYDNEDITITSTRPVTIPRAENTSAKVTVSSTVFSFGFTMDPVRYLTNEMSYENDFAHKLKKRLWACGAAIDTHLLSQLNTYKTQVFGFDGGGQYDTTNDIFTASSRAAAGNLLNDVKIGMGANDYYGQYDMIMNPGMESLVSELAKYGLYNEKDNSMQFSGFDYATSNRLANPTDFAGCGYAIEKGNLGIMFRHEGEALLGTTALTGHQWRKTTLPVLGLPCDSYYYEGVADISSVDATVSHVTRARTQYFHWAVEMATLISYNDDLTAYANPIMKFGYKAGL